MKKQLTITQKIKALAALLVIILLVIATNLINSKHFKAIQESINTVYSDRLVVMDYIYKISSELDRKKSALHNGRIGEIKTTHIPADEHIRDLIDKYADTKLTEKEAELFQVLQKEIHVLNSLEEKLLDPQFSDQELSLTVADIELQFAIISKSLDALSGIQIAEGQREINASNRAISSSKLILRFEISALIAIGLLIQMLLFYKPPSLTDPSRIHLN